MLTLNSYTIERTRKDLASRSSVELSKLAALLDPSDEIERSVLGMIRMELMNRGDVCSLVEAIASSV